MKRGIIALLLLSIAVVLVGGWWWARRSPESVTQFLTDDGLDASRAQDFAELIGGEVDEDDSDVLVASGSIEGDVVSIVSELAGLILELDAEAGDQVRAGQVLVRLDDSVLAAQMGQAEAAVQVATANLESVRAGSHPAEILAAQAAFEQAVAERDAAEMSWKDLQIILDSPHEIDARLVEARTAVEVAVAQVEQAEAELASAVVDRDQYQARGSLEEKKLYAVHNYRVEAAQAALDGTRANLTGARKTEAALKALRDNPLALVSQVHGAEAQLKIAAAGVGVAQAKLDELAAAAMPEAVAVAEAQVHQAKAALLLLQAQIDKMTLRSPVDGVVTSRSGHAGEATIAGVTLVTVAKLDEVTLMIYVPEDELNRVYLGQEVEVMVDSFPGQVFTGMVSYISQQAEFTPKNVQTQEARVNMVFAVKIRLPNPEHLLKPGMPADAVIRK